MATNCKWLVAFPCSSSLFPDLCVPYVHLLVNRLCPTMTVYDSSTAPDASSDNIHLSFCVIFEFGSPSLGYSPAWPFSHSSTVHLQAPNCTKPVYGSMSQNIGRALPFSCHAYDSLFRICPNWWSDTVLMLQMKWLAS